MLKIVLSRDRSAAFVTASIGGLKHLKKDAFKILFVFEGYL